MNRRSSKSPPRDQTIKPSKLKYGLKRSSIKDDELNKVCYLSFDRLELKAECDLRDFYKIDVYNQLNTNSCSANAICQQIKLLNQKMLKKDIEPSRRFIYFNSRLLDREKEGSKREILDEGATLISAFESLNIYRFCSDNRCSFEIEKVNSFPPPDAYLSAFENNDNITSYKRIVPSLYNFKYIISVLKKPIVFGISIYESFEKLTKENDILNIPTESEDYYGLHALAAVGYSDATQTFLICNSHGTSFASDGYFRLTYKFMMDPTLSFEHYILE